MRMIDIMPDEDGTPPTVSSLVQINAESVPEIDFTYFFNDSFALELFAAELHSYLLLQYSIRSRTSVLS